MLDCAGQCVAASRGLSAERLPRRLVSQMLARLAARGTVVDQLVSGAVLKELTLCHCLLYLELRRSKQLRKDPCHLGHSIAPMPVHWYLRMSSQDRTDMVGRTVPEVDAEPGVLESEHFAKHMIRSTKLGMGSIVAQRESRRDRKLVLGLERSQAQASADTLVRSVQPRHEVKQDLEHQFPTQRAVEILNLSSKSGWPSLKLETAVEMVVAKIAAPKDSAAVAVVWEIFVEEECFELTAAVETASAPDKVQALVDHTAVAE